MPRPSAWATRKESPLNENEINARYVFDMIYDPAETRLMKLAKERGAEVIPGIEMFVHQAARQFEIWTGKPAPWDDMLRVVTLALNERTAARQAPRSITSVCGPKTRSRPLTLPTKKNAPAPRQGRRTVHFVKASTV